MFIVIFSWNLFCSQGNYQKFPTITWSDLKNQDYTIIYEDTESNVIIVKVGDKTYIIEINNA
jgi:hypothetical protein